MIQVGVSCEEGAQFNFRSESDFDVHKDTIADIEDALQKLEVKKAPEIRTNVVAQQNAKLPKLRKMAEKPVRTENRIIGTVNGEKEVKCPVYDLEVAGVGKANGNRFSTEFAELDLYMLTSVPNAHPEKQR